MTIEELRALFKKHSDEYLKDDRIGLERMHRRPDICAFMMLDFLNEAQNGACYEDVVTWAGHDEIGLGVHPEQILDIITEQAVIDLIRCGVLLSDDTFTMFV